MLLLGATGAVFAQQQVGNIYVEITDNAGAKLPGVTVTVEGYGAPRVQVTNANGQARFLSLDPGQYQMAAELSGFSTLEYPSVDVRIGRNTTLELEMSSAVEETITVTSESPLLDERKIQTGTTISSIELEKIPTSRDPWGVAAQTPGVQVDRINVGGNESGQQSNFRGPGVSDDENTFMVDGVEITDMRALGASPTYYDFDQFSEMQFGTGGSDATKTTAGVGVNLVTKRGSNEFRGSARFLVTDGGGFFGGSLEQATPSIEGDLAEGQASLSGNRINRIEDYGFEAGGPIVRDKAWAWGSYGKNDIRNITANGSSDDTLLINNSLKVNVQLTPANSGVVSWNVGDKNKFGRGASPTRPDETSWNQRGPSDVYKLEDTHVWNSNVFTTFTASKVDGGFSLTSKAVIADGLDGAPQSYRDSDRIWRGSYLNGFAVGVTEELKADGSYFFDTGSTNHELKFGARQREFDTTSTFVWSQGNIFHINAFGEDGVGGKLLLPKRGIAPPVLQTYTSAWLQDTISAGNLTFNVGLRYDLQEGENQAIVVEGNPIFADLMPALDYQGADAGFDWSSISPRLGVTYAMGASNQTLLRASLSEFPDQLGSGDVNRINPAGEAYATIYWYDSNGDNAFQQDEYWTLLATSGFDAADPTALVSPNVNDAGMDAPVTRELTAAIEHAFRPEFVMGANVTLRNVSDILEDRRFVRDGSGNVRTVTAADYEVEYFLTPDPDNGGPNFLPGGGSYNEPVYTLVDGLSYTGGSIRQNGSRERDYFGYGVNFTKRLANRWMARGYLNFGEAEWDIPADYLNNSSPTRAEEGSDANGGLYATQAAGSGAKSNVWIQSSWQWNLNGLYQVAPDKPWGFNVAANLYGREGYVLPYFNDDTPTADGLNPDVLIVNNIEDFRAEDVFTADVRVEKEFSSSGNVGFTFSLDAFNVLNNNAVLQRQRAVNGQTDYLFETLSPRVYRMGVRLNWR
jgi:hypothetical protein